MKARTLIVGAALWLGVVAVGSGITWLVIEQVGRNVVSGQDPSGTSAVTGVPVPSSPPSTSTPTPSASAVPRSTPSATPATTAPRPTSHTSKPAPTPATPGGKSPRTTDPVTPRKVTRTWSGSAGHLTVSCSGSRVELVSASPSDGWRVEIGSRGPEEVEVEFKQGGEGAETHVKSRCSGGEPRFDMESDD